MVLQDDAAALAADILMLQAARGRDVRVADPVWLMRYAGLILSLFETRPGTEDSDG